MIHLPFRQVHLDFHTSPYIPEVGADFNADEFVETLQDAHVNSVTVFAKCHHGYSYYPTKVGTPHPHLKRDLLGEMIEAAHRAGIRVPVYTTVVWDELAWATHPEWRQLSPEGHIRGATDTPLKPGWKDLCMNTGYVDYFIAQVEEILDWYDGDGLFIDIVRYFKGACVCSTCLSQIVDQSLDPDDPEQLRLFTLNSERQFMRRVTQTIRSKKPEQSIFYNGRLRMDWNPESGNHPEMDDFTHLEIESLPGGSWGYDHFPMYVRYLQTFDRPLTMMTGRFHTTWGDFGGLRNREALAFECFQALAHGATCSIGDQLHPRGRLDLAVYQRIGEVYAEVQRREAWCEDTQALAEIGVITAAARSTDIYPVHESDRGALHILEQLKHQFQFIDAGGDLAAYSVVILPDEVPVDRTLAERLRAYLALGGRLLISNRSGLDEAAGDFVLAAEMGVHYAGQAEYAPDYLVLEPELTEAIEPMHHVCTHQGTRVTTGADVQVLARSGAPYFNRTWRHFSSHQYTPMERVTDEPVITQKGNIIYVARPLFSEYAETSMRAHRQVITNCLKRLLLRPRIGLHNLPSTAIVTVRRQTISNQPFQNLLVHVLHYVHQRRGQRNLDVIEDILPLHDVEISVRVNSSPSLVRLVPEGEAIPWTYGDSYVRFIVPEVKGYQIVELAGADI